MDLSGYINKNMEIPYVGGETVDISTTDHTFSDGPARGLIVTATGNVVFVMYGNGYTVTLPVVVAAGHFIEVRGFLISSITKTGTTATVLCGLY